MAAIPSDKDVTTASVTDATNGKVTISVEDCDRTRWPGEKTPTEEMRERIQNMSRKEFRKYFRKKRG